MEKRPIPPHEQTQMAMAAAGVLGAEPNELSTKWLGVCGLNPFHIHDSSARLQMLSQHLGQMLVIKGSTPRQLQTGAERVYGQYTYRVEMPCNGRIIARIPRYNTNSLSSNSIEENPQTILIYESEGEDGKTKEYGIVDLVDYCSNHQYFGFRYKKAPGWEQIRVGADIRKGTVFLDSPSITHEGDYAYGIQANVAFMTHPATSEDGIAVSSTFMKRLGFRTYETRVVEWGSKSFALNLYGNDEHYKPFPDIGERIRDDGLLMALRDYEPAELAIVEQSVKACQRVDFTFDETVYANGAGGRVVDIRINHDLADYNCAAVHMDKQPQKYDAARRAFYGEILKEYNQLRYRREGNLRITPAFHQLVVQAQSVMSEGGKQRVTKLYRKARLDTYRVEFVIEYEMLPNIGSKLTDLHGGKGVTCQIIPEEHMPRDQDGNVADLIMDPNATINRANPGRMYEQYYNAACRDTHKRLCAQLGVTPFTKEIPAFNHIQKLPAEQIAQAWDYLLRFYEKIAPEMRDWFTNGTITDTPTEYLAQIVHKGIGLFIPPDHRSVAAKVVMDLERSAEYKPLYGPVTYVGNSGNRVTTVKPARIGGVYVILLEKTGDDWNAVSSGKLQLFGVLGQLTKMDKYSRPSRNNAVRVAGESEMRILLANCGERFAAEIMDRNNNPATHQAMLRGILAADKPGSIPTLVDRVAIPYGGSKSLQLLKHMCQVGGVEFEFQPHNPNLPKVNMERM